MNIHIVTANEKERSALTLRSQTHEEAGCLSSLIPRTGQTLRAELERGDAGSVVLKLQVIGEVTKGQSSDKTIKIAAMTRQQLLRLAAEKGVDAGEDQTDSELARLLGDETEKEADHVRNG